GVGRAGHRFVDQESLKLVQPTARQLPLVRRLPIEGGLQGFGCAPAVRVAEPRENAARGDDPEGLDQLAAKQAERDGVKQDGAVASETNVAALGRKLEQFAE